MSSRGQIPGLLVATTLVFALIIVVSVALTPRLPILVGTIANSLVFGAGAIIVWKTEQRRIGWLLIALGVMFQLLGGVLLGIAERFQIESIERYLDAGIWGIAILIYLILIFPTGRLPTRLSRVVVWLAVVGGLAFSVYDWIVWSPNEDSFVGVLFFALLIVVAVGIHIGHLKHRSVIERKQLKWFLYALALAASIYIVLGLTRPPDEVFLVADAAATSLWPIAILIAITRYSLYEIDRIVSRTVAYGLVVGLLALVFVAVVSAIGALLPTEDSLAVAASTLIVAALFNPLRLRIQRSIDRRFDRARYEAQEVFDEFVASLQDETDVAVILERLETVASETMRPSVIGSWCDDRAN